MSLPRLAAVRGAGPGWPRGLRVLAYGTAFSRAALSALGAPPWAVVTYSPCRVYFARELRLVGPSTGHFHQTDHMAPESAAATRAALLPAALAAADRAGA